MPARTYKWTDAELDSIKELAEVEGISQIEVLRRALEQYRCNTEATPGNTDAIEVLAAQLEAKDAQIAGLIAALDKTADTTRGAQALHAQERVAIESTEQKRRRGLRGRIMDLLGYPSADIGPRVP